MLKLGTKKKRKKRSGKKVKRSITTMSKRAIQPTIPRIKAITTVHWVSRNTWSETVIIWRMKPNERAQPGIRYYEVLPVVGGEEQIAKMSYNSFLDMYGISIAPGELLQIEFSVKAQRKDEQVKDAVAK